MNFLNTIFRICAWGAVFCFLLKEGTFAQVLDDEPSRQFSVLAYGEGFFDDLVFERKAEETTELVDLRFAPDRRSQWYGLPEGQDEIAIFSKNTDPDGLESLALHGLVRVPAEADRFLLLFREGIDFGNSGRYEIELIDESDGEWGPGCYRFLNLTGVALECRLGPHVGELPEGLSAVIRFPVEREEQEPALLEMSLMVEGRKSVIYSSETLPDPNYGRLIVIKPPVKEDSLRIRLITVW